MPVAFTEWNLDGQDMRTGLFTAGFLNMLERTPECSIAEAALMLRHTSAGGWNNGIRQLRPARMVLCAERRRVQAMERKLSAAKDYHTRIFLDRCRGM